MNTAFQRPLRAFRLACIIAGGAVASMTMVSGQVIAIDDGTVGEAYSSDKAVRDWSPDPIPVDLVHTASNLPDGLSINQSSGIISGVPTTEGDYAATITYTYNGGESNDVTATLTIAPQAGTPEITSSATSSGTVGVAYMFTLTASNMPTAYNVDPGQLPGGLTANSTTGEISGTPTTAGTFALNVTANNAVGTGGAATHTITIDPAGDLSEISSTSTRTVDVNEAFSYQIVANNTPTLYEANSLPPGLTMSDTSTGFISGTITDAGTYIVEIRVQNEFGWSEVFNLTITVGAVPQISSVLTLSLTELTAMDDFTVTASNTPTTYSVIGLPSGLSFNSTSKVISGTPAAPGVTNVSIFAINGVGQGPTSTLVITVAAGSVPVVTSAATLTSEVNTELTYTIVATNTPTSYAATGLPAGVTIATNIISGTPTTAGIYPVSITATNLFGTSGTLTLTMTVESGFVPEPTPNFRPASYSTGMIGEKKYIYINFKQSAEDLTAFDYVIEISSDLEAWTTTALDQLGDLVEISDNGDGTKTVKVRYPDSFDESTPQYMRYEVSAKQ